MALFHSIVFDRLHQKVGGVVCYERCGQQVMRSCPERIRNPRTPAQQKNRLRFSACNRLAACFQPYLPLGFPARYATQSRDAFIQANGEVFNINEQLEVQADYRRLHCSAGRQTPPEASVVRQENSLQVDLAGQPVSAYCFRQDAVYLLLWAPQTNDIQLEALGRRGTYGSRQVNLQPEMRQPELYGYVFAVSAHGHRASETVNVLYPRENESKKNENLGK